MANERGKKPRLEEQPVTAFTPMFEHFRAELDEHQDRRERIIKANRDITAASKKIIFALQRARSIGAPLPASISSATAPHYEIVKSNLSTLIADVAPPNHHRYGRQLFGLQELIEALTFQHYLSTQTLLSHAAAQGWIDDLAGSPGIPLSEDDYVQGVFDLTGELMRYAVTGMASGGVPAGPGGRSVLADMQTLRARLEMLDAAAGSPRAWAGKMEVMQASCGKVERALYGLVVRGRERPKGWMPEVEGRAGGRDEVEGY